jgi:hypothetical protein
MMRRLFGALINDKQPQSDYFLSNSPQGGTEQAEFKRSFRTAK